MGMAKKETTAIKPDDLGTIITTNPPQLKEGGQASSIESGAVAAIDRLSKTTTSKAATPAYKARDYEAEAIGKTRCVQFEAALMSPAIAGMKFDTMEQYLVLVKQAADAGVAYSFQK